MNEPRKIVLLGATGSIGGNTLRVIRQHPDKLKLVGVAARSSGQELARIVREFNVPNACLTDPNAAIEAKRNDFFPGDCTVFSGPEGLTEIAAVPEADIVLVAIVGVAALKPTLAAIGVGHDIALASKEILVLGGAFVVEAAQKAGVQLLPTDSEHNAIFQCLQGNPHSQLDRIILTASGGRFRDRDPATLDTVTQEEATHHPNWSMGPKITVDSATMANKGLELIEAYWLFNLDPSRLDVVIHRQSIVHSFVQFVDGSILGQLSPPTMTFAIQHCLLYPDRASGTDATLDFRNAFSLEFAPVPEKRYPCLDLAYAAMQSGPAAMAVFNAANEVAVDRFLGGKVRFTDIPRIIEATLNTETASRPAPSLDDLFAIDLEARKTANEEGG